MSWLYDDQDLVQEPPPAPDESSTAPSTAHDFELFHEQVAPIDVGQSDLPPATGEQGIKHVRVRNLQWWTNENTLRDILSECGVIKSVEFEASMKNGKSLGIANIEFETSDAALRAIDLIDNRDVDGKPVNASLLVVEDVKVSGPLPSQSQRQLAPNQFRKQVSPKRPAAKSPTRVMNSTVRDTPAVDPARQAKVSSSRENSTAKSVRQSDHRHHNTDRNTTSTRDTDQDGALHSHSNSVPDGKDRDQTSRPRSSSSHHGHQTSHHRHPGSSSSHKDQDRALRGASSRRGARSETPKIDAHHSRDNDFRRAPPPSDSKYSSSHSRHTDTERAGSRCDVRPDHDRSNHRSSHHRDYDAGRASRRMQQDYSKEHGSSTDRYRDRHRDRVEVSVRDRHSHYTELDHRPRKKRR